MVNLRKVFFDVIKNQLNSLRLQRDVIIPEANSSQRNAQNSSKPTVLSQAETSIADRSLQRAVPWTERKTTDQEIHMSNDRSKEKKSLGDIKMELEKMTAQLEEFTGIPSAEVDADPAPKTIATININLKYDARAKFLDDQHNCPLCGTELLQTHVTHFANQAVQEEAHCEKCKIRVRSNEHQLQ
jgi:hypothetical protein